MPLYIHPCLITYHLLDARRLQKSIGGYSERFTADSEVCQHLIGRNTFLWVEVQHSFQDHSDIVTEGDAGMVLHRMGGTW